MKKKNYLLALFLTLVSLSIFAQGPDNPPPPMDNPEIVPIDSWTLIMVLPALLLAFFTFYKAKSKS